MRQTMLNAELQAQIIQYLEIGVTITDLCHAVGIDIHTYYNWRNWGEQAQNDRRVLLESGYDLGDPEVVKFDANPFIPFFQATTRASARANIGAVVAIKSALTGQQETTQTVTKLTETKLRKKRITYEDGRVEVIEEPYDYTKTTVTDSVTKLPPDARAAFEFLRRRAPKEWAATATENTDWQPILLEMVKSGNYTYGDLEAELGPEMAMEIFQLAGKQVLRLHE